MKTCTVCGRTMFSITCHCPPEWEVCDADDSDDSDDWTVVRAVDETDAAEQYAEKCDGQGDGARERTVLVRKPGTTDAKRFSITFEYTVNYHAYEQQPEDPCQ